MRLKWKRLILFFAFLAGLNVQSLAVAGGGDDVNPNICIWKGTITIHREGSGKPVQPKPEKGKTVVVSGSHTVNETIVIEVCGDPNSLYVKNVTRELRDDSIHEENQQVDEMLCRFPKEMLRPGAEWPEDRGKYQPQTKRPGNRSTVKLDTHTTILRGLDLPKLRDNTNVRIEFPDPQRFTISGSQKALADYRSDHTVRYYDVCAETHSDKDISERTGALGQEPISDHVVNKQGWDTHEIIKHIRPPQELLEQFSFEAPFTGLELKGSKVIDRVQTEEFESTETASWDLKGESPCPDVYRQLLQDLTYAEAYADRKIADFADSIDEYEKLVEDRAYKIRYGANAPRGEDSSEIDASTDEHGQQSGLEKLMQKLEESCKPDIIFASISAHEDVHTQQKEKYPEYNDGKPRTFGLMEVSAYVVDAQMLMDWLRENCPGTNLSDAARRLRNLQKLADRYIP
ncbi:MAG: hypothetical protein JXA73_23420 [Acidobacteria bacterium]|nr:hypothetical protein [Acidobacteriota bacterium]